MVVKPDYEQVLLLARQLSRPDQKRLLADVAYRTQTADQFEVNEVLVWEAIQNCLIRPGTERPSTKVLQNCEVTRTAYAELTNEIVELVQHGTGQLVIKRHLRRLLFNRVLECVAESWPVGKPLVLKNVLRWCANAGNITWSVNQTFPGYIEAGMLLYILPR